jgi:hypothetical protein
MRNIYKTLVGKPEGKRPLKSWENNIKMDHRETGFGDVDWVSQNVGNVLTKCTVSLPRWTLLHGVT